MHNITYKYTRIIIQFSTLYYFGLTFPVCILNTRVGIDIAYTFLLFSETLHWSYSDCTKLYCKRFINSNYMYTLSVRLGLDKVLVTYLKHFQTL